MSTQNFELGDEVNNGSIHNPCRRRRSSSLGSKKNRDNILVSKDKSENLQRYASSNNLWDNVVKTTVDSDTSQYSPKVTKRRNSDNEHLEDLFVNWYKDSKSVKIILTRLYENNIFKMGIPILENLNFSDYFPPVIFLITSNLKVETDYEIYTINNYDVRISELMSWSVDNKKDLYDDYHRGMKAINQKVVDIANADINQEDLKKISDEGTKKSRRHSEIMGLMVINKNQPISTFLPNRTLTSFEVVNKFSEVILTDQSRKTDKSSRHVILSNEMISIFMAKKTERLKYKFYLKHLYCGTCSDHQIPNIDSSLRIGGPFGDDLILTFSNPNSRNEWYNAIQNSISTFLEVFKTQSSDITIWKNIELNSSAPLVSKVFSISGKITSLELKKKAIEGFNQNEKNINDFILTFTVPGTNRECILHDDVMVMIFQEHIGCFGDVNSCSESCGNIGNSTLLSRIPIYLKYNPIRDISKVKKPKPTFDVKAIKTRQYLINEKWSDNLIPEWLMKLLSDIYHEGSQTEGIFRMSGVKSKSDELIQMICENGDDIEIKEEIHIKATILKKFLSAIDGSLFTFANKEKLISLSNEIISFDDFCKNSDQINKILSIIQSLPHNNHNFFQVFLVVIDNIRKNEAINKMNLANLSVCLGPTILTEMNEVSLDDYLKTKTLLECIFSLFDKIVDENIQKKIVASFNERRASLDHCNVVTTHEDISSNTAINIKSTIPEVSIITDSSKPVEPSVPPRRKRRDNAKLKYDNSPASTFNDIKETQIRPEILNLNNIVTKDKEVDQFDSRVNVIQPKTETVNMQEEEHIRTKHIRRKKISRERHTVAVTEDKQSKYQSESRVITKTPDALQSSPFRRQNQVNRKYRDHSLSNYKINEIGEKSNDVVQESLTQDEPKASVKITKKNDQTVLDKESRSRDRTHHYKPSDKSQLIRGRYVFNARSDLKEGQRDEYRRSSSQSRVQTMVQEIEKKSREKNDYDLKMVSTPNQKKDIIKDLEIGKRITRNNNVITKKQNRSRNNVTGPIRPIHNVSDNNTTQRLTNGRPPSSIQRSNTVESTLKSEFERVKDQEIMYI